MRHTTRHVIEMNICIYKHVRYSCLRHVLTNSVITQHLGNSDSIGFCIGFNLKKDAGVIQGVTR